VSEEGSSARFVPWRVVVGPLLFSLTLVFPAPEAFTPAGWQVLGLMLWMATWWALEAVPLSATALLPLVIVPIVGVSQSERILLEYANSSVFLILGGFLIALGMERWQLHKRIAYRIMATIGSEPRRLVLGVMVATAFVSMWVSNTSSALMMLPVAMAIATLATLGHENTRDATNFSAALLLGVAYGATIGGLGTLIGTPTNALVQGFMARNFAIEVSFLSWLGFGLPAVAALLPLAWWLMTRISLPFSSAQLGSTREPVEEALRKLGAISVAEQRVAMVACTAALLWVVRPWLNQFGPLAGLNDTAIAIGAGLSLFVIPSGFDVVGQRRSLVTIEELSRIPWNILVLFGGGLSLAAAIQESGLAATIAQAVSGLADWPLPLLVGAVVVLLVVWTELNSNVATAATFMPVLAALAVASEHAPLDLIAPAAMASSAAFMMPVGTPANALVFGTGKITLAQMMRTGLLINVAAVIVITAIGLAVAALRA
jgi:sodium-dependent dicarboxylate transporter 2/3/5